MDQVMFMQYVKFQMETIPRMLASGKEDSESMDLLLSLFGIIQRMVEFGQEDVMDNLHTSLEGYLVSRLSPDSNLTIKPDLFLTIMTSVWIQKNLDGSKVALVGLRAA
jgi:hypothetical protein